MHIPASLDHRTQLVVMSAALDSLDSLGRWLHARCYRTDNRPIQLCHYLGIGPDLIDPMSLQVARRLPDELIIKDDVDNIIGYCLETMLDGHGVLVFCGSKMSCENLALSFVRFVHFVLQNAASSSFGRLLSTQLNCPEQMKFLESFRQSWTCMDSVLEKTLPYGVAFHHAGLAMEEREQIELGFRHGIIRLLAATSTLSSGVNLPARRVVIRASCKARMTAVGYVQMAGRAGRKGIDDKGESILVCKREDVNRGSQMVDGKLEPIKSAVQLDGRSDESGRHLKRFVLEAICGGITPTTKSLTSFMNSTLIAQQCDQDQMASAVARCVSELVESRFIELESDDTFSSTQLGCAAVVSALGVDDSLSIFADLNRAQRSLALDNELHMLYLVTPLNSFNFWTPTLDWSCYYSLWCKLSSRLKNVARLVGIEERFLIEKVQGKTNSKEPRQEAIHLRFLAALALHDLIEERPLNEIALKFRLNRGALQSLQQQAATYACMVVAFCDRLGWFHLKTLLDEFASRLAFGIRRDLTDLVRIDGVDGNRARIMHSEDLNSAIILSRTPVTRIVAVLRKCVPFSCDGDRNVWLAGHPELNDREAAQLLITRAKAVVAEDCRKLGLKLPAEFENRLQPCRSDVAEDDSNMNTVSSSLNEMRTSSERILAELDSKNDGKSPEKSSTSIKHSSSMKSIANSADFNFSVSDSMLIEMPSPILHQDVVSNLTKTVRRITSSPTKLADYSVNDSMLLEVIGDGNVHESSSRDMFDVSTPSSSQSSRPTNRRRSRSFSPSLSSPLTKKIKLIEEDIFSVNDVCANSETWLKFVNLSNLWTEVSFAFVVRDGSSNEGIHFNCDKSSIVAVALCPFEGPCCLISLSDYQNRLLIADSVPLSTRKTIILRLFSSRRITHFCWNGRKTTRMLCQFDEDTEWTGIKSMTHLAGFDSISVNNDGDDDRSMKLVELTRQFAVQSIAPDYLITGPARNSPLGACVIARVLARISVRLRSLATANAGEKMVRLRLDVDTILGRIEAVGFALNRQLCRRWLADFRCRLSELEKDAHRLAGIDFNLESPASVAKILFDRLRLPFPDHISTSKRHYSTSKTVLTSLFAYHPLPSVIFDHRQINNALQTFLFPLSNLIDNDNRIRGRFRGYSSTGRVSMRDPNLQNVPKTTFDFHSGQSLREIFTVEPNLTLLSLDYSQLELRILAHLSGDVKLLSILNTREGDVFDSIGLQWRSKFGPVDRQKIKQLCYGVIYGMGFATLAKQMNVDADTARQFIDYFYMQFPSVRRWIDDTIEMCERRSSIKTILGRTLKLPDINSPVQSSKAKAKRQAVNSTVQGSAADIFHCALVDVQRVCQLNHSRLVLQIHDEILIETPASSFRSIALQLSTAMEMVRTDLKVRLVVNVKSGLNWGSLQILTF